ncbi:hypothetical protein ACFX19_028577 [Malus domestica]
MSDKEHQFESKVDTGASKTILSTIRKNGYIVMKAKPCKVYFFSNFSNSRCNFSGLLGQNSSGFCGFARSLCAEEER